MGRGSSLLARTLRCLFVCSLLLALLAPSGLISARPYTAPATPKPTPAPAVFPVSVMPLARAEAVLQQLYPHASIRIDRGSHSLIVVATPDQENAMRAVLQGIDVKNPEDPQIEVVPLHVLKAGALVARLRGLFPSARIEAASPSSILLQATPQDMQQIKALIGSLDTAVSTPQPTSAPVEGVRVTQALPRSVARAVAAQFPHLRASVSGSTILLEGSSDDITQAKSLIAQLDAPAFGARYTQVYRLHNVDAQSVADLITRSYPNVHVTVDAAINALAVQGTAAEQQRIGDAIAQLDGATTNGQPAQPGAGGAAYGDGNVAVVDLDAAIPGQQGAPSTSAQDVATALTQALGQLAPDLRVTVPANTNELLLTGSPTSVRMAKDLIAKIDRTPPQVELDTEIFEIDTELCVGGNRHVRHRRSHRSRGKRCRLRMGGIRREAGL